ncbi:hypothetical protein B1C78_16875 [Thioalkalivibrio denitrificans]|uniref:Cytochrome C n=2 Tax=Thioalkalivibrio denitrificans TaxID=108003 RepID=A0A1V3N7M1_9GAMM|nr:hypothetical protein B1C78_16875 [Thioalkalivibrio denitrificans]
MLLAGLASGLLTMVPKTAEAVPSFARQTGQACVACHTQPPRLNQFGREFKISGYRANMIPLLHGADIQENMPLSARVRGDIRHNFDGDNETHVSAPDPIRLYVAGRMTEYTGVYVQALGDEDDRTEMQLSLANEFGDWTLGIAGGNVGFGRSDPYDTLSRGTGSQLSRNVVSTYDREDLRSGSLRNRGTGGMAYAYGNGMYFGVGAFDTSGDEEDLKDYAVRVAYEPQLGDGDAHIGAFWFQADKHDYRRRGDDSDATDRGRRMGVDASYQWDLGNGWKGDVLGVYLIGRQEVRGDVNAPAALGPDYNVDHSGWFVGATFHRGPWAFGLNYGQYEYEDDYSDRGTLVPGGTKVTSINPSVGWMFAPNARLGFDVEVLDNELSGYDDTRARMRFDIGF